RQEENGTDKKALLRFPKADTEYHYYDHADEEGHYVTVDKSKHHRLAADGVATGMVQITPIKNADEDNPYYMVGNPYMASVRMELFFNANPHLVKTYWVVSNDAALSATEATGLGIIGPMQSFFVKTEDGQPVTNVLFSPAMTVSHLVSGAAEASETDDAETISFTTRATANVPMAQTRVVLSAEADNGFVDEEDVETLLDSNLEDVPMVYTVAGTQAAMVNRLNDVTLLPLGLFGAEGETVDVQVHGVDRFSQTLYFYDASTGKQTALEEGTALSLEANVHGRYFLTTRALEDDVVTDDTDWQVRAYSLQRGELIVASMPQDNLRQVRIYGVNGHQVVNDATAQGHVATYALPSGIYVAEVVTERLSRPQVVKVVVR
ncbi:MAG: T9SS type A sorting domain-containing protein, partial [Bacteroidaceae bacterium]|nr:T9SS type A sorting domain-containing protein [Bacteroidaceae bacterium]